MSLRPFWEPSALSELERAAEHSPAQAHAVVAAVEWMATVGFSLGRRVRGTDARYWPVPPLGVFYRVDGSSLRVLNVIDARRRREPW